jgi:hypothetical protein
MRINGIMIPPDQGFCILSLLLSHLKTVHKRIAVVNDRPIITRSRVDNVFSVNVRNPDRVVN